MDVYGNVAWAPSGVMGFKFHTAEAIGFYLALNISWCILQEVYTMRSIHSIIKSFAPYA